MSNPPSRIARNFYDAIERGLHGDALKAHFTDSAVTIEHPNLIKPRGATTELALMLTASSAGAGLLAKQTYDVREVLEHGDTAAIRLTWTGVLATTAGPFVEGQVLTAHIAQFVTVRDGKIAAIETYDCYAPFSDA